WSVLLCFAVSFFSFSFLSFWAVTALCYGFVFVFFILLCVLCCFSFAFSHVYLFYEKRCSHCHNNKPLNTFDISWAGYLFTTCHQYLARQRKNCVVANDNSLYITQACNTEALDAAEATGPGVIPTPPLPVMHGC
ncbi:hypothetical protein B0T25DRAFT_543102, partial [Lasiosphaeria hispida]